MKTASLVTLTVLLAISCDRTVTETDAVTSFNPSLTHPEIGTHFVVLNPTNSFRDDIEPGVAAQRSTTGRGGPLVGLNLEFSCGSCDVATFVDAVTVIGTANGFCGYPTRIPRRIVENDDRVCARSTISEELFDIDLLTWSDPGGCFENPVGSCQAAAGYTSYLRSVARPESRIASLIDAVHALHENGTLGRGNANALVRKLENALKSMEKDHIGAAANQIGAFINQVNAFIRSGSLTAEQGQSLVDAAQSVIDQLTS